MQRPGRVTLYRHGGYAPPLNLEFAEESDVLHLYRA
jgi:hypothetical protein